MPVIFFVPSLSGEVAVNWAVVNKITASDMAARAKMFRVEKGDGWKMVTVRSANAEPHKPQRMEHPLVPLAIQPML